MSAFDAVACAVGEGAVFIAGRIIGKRCGFPPQKTRRIGEYIVLGAFTAFFVCLALLGIGT